MKILTIDLGGTKTRLAQFRGAEVAAEVEFPTAADANACIANISAAIRAEFADFATFSDDNVVALATRGLISPDGAVSDARLDWHGLPIAKLLSEQLGDTRVLLGNDAKLGALGAFPPDFRGRGLYLTIGTGIGGGLMLDGHLSSDLDAMEVGKIQLRHDGAWQTWESFASGYAFSTKYNDFGENIPAGSPIWHDYAADLAAGIVALLPVLRPDKIVIGGGISQLFDKFGELLRQLVSDTAWQPAIPAEISAAADARHTVNRGAAIFALNQLKHDGQE